MLLLIDNYDSFSYNLYQLIGAIEPDIKVIRNDEMTVEEIIEMKPDGIIISPGPGRPEDAGIITELVRTLGQANKDKAYSEENKINSTADNKEAKKQEPYIDNKKSISIEGCIPVLGVCLGHQAICQAFGGTITYARELMHGKQSITEFDKSSVIFTDVPKMAPVARYHSLALDENTLPKELRITAKTIDGDVMAVEHRMLPIYGMQFHPESIMTPDGDKMLKSFIELTRKGKNK